MAITSGYFLLFVLVGLVAFYASWRPLWRQFVLCALNLLFVASYADSPLALVPLGIFIAVGFLSLRWIMADRGGWAFAVSLVAYVLGFLYLKHYSLLSFLPPLGFPYAIVGLSYLFFRIVHLIIDAREGALLSRPSLLQYLNYNCSFLCWVAGPIQRWPDYCDAEAGALSTSKLSSDEVFSAFSRAVNGYLKVLLLSPFFESYHLKAAELAKLHLMDVQGVAAFSFASVAYLLYLYVNFSGYMDIVIGVGRLFGFKLPENFRYPLRSENFLDFWNHWHITLSEWFKFYVFNPLVKALNQRWSSPAILPYWGVLAYFTTFLLLGIWHGPTPPYILLGFLLGLGVATNKLYEVKARLFLGRDRFAKLRKAPVYRAACHSFTLVYFSFSLCTMWVVGTPYQAVAGQLLAKAFLFSFAFIFLVRHTWPPRGQPSNQPSTNQLWLAFRACVVILCLTYDQSVSDFVYKGF